MQLGLRKLRDQKGSLVIIIPITLAIVIGSILMFYNLKASHQALGYATLKNDLHSVSSKIFISVKDSFDKKNLGCIDTRDFFKLDSVNPVEIEWNTLSQFTACLISEEDVIRIESISLSLTRVPGVNDKDLGMTRVKFSLHIQSKQELFGPLVEIKETRYLRIKIGSLADFAVVAPQFSNSSPFLTSDAASKVTIMGMTFFNLKNEALDIDQLSSQDIFSQSTNLVFQDLVISNAPSSKMPSNYLGSVGDLMTSTFRFGLHLGEFADVEKFPFELMTSEWSQPIDYNHVFNSGGYPLPAHSSYAHSAGGLNRGNSTHGAFNQFPNLAVSDLIETCRSIKTTTIGTTRPLVLLKNGQDISLDISTSKIFCGFVIANHLKVKVPAGQQALLIGSFWVNSIEIEGTGDLIIFNPFSYRTSPSALIDANGVSIQNVSQQLHMLRATIGHNFFLPLYRSSVGISGGGRFMPENLNVNFSPCGSFYCWKSPIVASNFHDLYTKPNWDSLVTFFVEETL